MILGIDASRATELQKTGVERYAFEIIEQLKKKLPNSEELRVILYTSKKVENELGELPPNWEIKYLSWPPKRFWTQIRLSLEMFFHPVDVLFIPAHVTPLIHPKKTIMMIHDVASLRFPKSYNWFERWYTVYSAKKALRKLPLVLTPSQFCKKELEHFFSGKRKAEIEVVEHGFTSMKKENAKQKKDAVLQKYSIDTPFIFFLGRVEYKKNIQGVVEAFEKWKKKSGKLHKLVLAGKPGFGYEEIHQQIKMAEYKEDILELGFVPDEDVDVLFEEASLFFFPSLYEGFGIPVLEAFDHETPVLTVKDSSLSEVGGDVALYSKGKSGDELAESLEYFFDNEESLKKEILPKMKKQLEKFSWNEAGERTAELIVGLGK